MIKFQRKAVARMRHTPGKMNKTEAEYASRLEIFKKSGLLSDYRFEAVKLRLANLTTYTPDFLVIDVDGSIVFHEVKGFWMDDARVKIKVAAELYPWFHFIAATKNKGNWELERF
jgi:hypothetical protein